VSWSELILLSELGYEVNNMATGLMLRPHDVEKMESAFVIPSAADPVVGDWSPAHWPSSTPAE
jgi:hypothetical protein